MVAGNSTTPNKFIRKPPLMFQQSIEKRRNKQIIMAGMTSRVLQKERQMQSTGNLHSFASTAPLNDRSRSRQEAIVHGSNTSERQPKASLVFSDYNSVSNFNSEQPLQNVSSQFMNVGGCFRNYASSSVVVTQSCQPRV